VIAGEITEALEGRVRITVFGPTGRSLDVNAVIDTGFNGVLALSSRHIADLQMPFQEKGLTMLGDGSVVEVEFYEGVVIWDGVDTVVSVEAQDGGALIGMELLEGYDLTMRVRPGGFVHIAPSPPEAADVAA
jgi:clan AA aspartic protease